MRSQAAVTVRAVVQPGRAGPVAQWLTDVDLDGRRPSLFPFEQLPVHFARFVVLPEAADLKGAPLPASVIFLSDIDGPAGTYLDRLAELAGEGLDGVFGHCEGYPATPDAMSRAAYLRARAVKDDAVYVNTIGRTVEQVHQEARLRDALEDLLDAPADGWSGRSPADVRSTLRRQVGEDPALAWARRRNPSLGWRWRLKEWAGLAAVVVPLLLLLPLLLVVLPLWLVAVRLLELRDVVRSSPPDPAHLRELTEREDLIVQNQFTAVGYLKPGLVRRATATVVLFGVNLAARHLFSRGNLAGVKTIHFARWIFLDDKRRLLFASNYDGSLESYMDDFIDKIAWSLNAAFSSGVDYPRTRWLLLGGAKDEQAFKTFIRNRQVPTQLWYSAYPHLSATNIANSAAIRVGLAGRRAEPAERWVRRL